MHRLAIYPGSFDPPTLGHLDVIERASRMFDRLIVSVGDNSSKKSLLSLNCKLEALRQSTAHLPNVEVDTFTGLLVEYTLSRGAKSIVRGLRATSDFEYEFQMAMVNRRLSAEVDTVFLMTKWEYSYLSSSIVREVALLGGDFSEMVPKQTVEILKRALSSE